MTDIVAERSKRGWSQAVLADKAGVHIRTLRRLENGEPVQPIMLERVLNAFSACRVVDRSPGSDALRRVTISQIQLKPGLMENFKFVILGIMVILPFAILFDYFLGKEDNLLMLIFPFLAIPVVMSISGDGHMMERQRLKLKPDCDLVLEAVRRGDLVRMTSAQVTKIQMIVGNEAFVRACHSSAADLKIENLGEMA